MSDVDRDGDDGLLAVLRSHDPLDASCQARGWSREEYDRRLAVYLAAKVPPQSIAVEAPIHRAVDIVRDRYGIAHVFADTSEDLFFGFGFALGQDRLWQLDWYRRRASGTLAAVIGPSAIDSDVEARTLGFREIAEQELAALPEASRRVLDAYAAGINAARASVEAKLPIEFEVLDYLPAAWTPLDSLTIQRASLWQFSGRIAGIVLAEAAMRLLPSHLAERFLALDLAEETIAPGGYAAGSLAGEATIVTGQTPHGSNQWSVSGGRSEMGPGAIVATDGHVPYAQPSDRYEVHLCGAGFDVLGMSLPGIPVFHNGRNRHVGWGVTNNVSSTRDLYIEEVDPSDPQRYREGGTYAPFLHRTETIEVRGEQAREVQIRSTTRGPIVNHLIQSVDPGGDAPLSLRWVGIEPYDTLTVQLDLARANSTASFRGIAAAGIGRTMNEGFGDADGHIGYQMVGRVPIRSRVTRGYRRAGEPADAWTGVAPFEQLPTELDPPRGWIASANNPPAPRDHPVPLYGAYADGYRMRRIRTLLESKPSFTVGDMGSFQFDTYLQRAADTCPALLRIIGDGLHSNIERAAIDALRAWDFQFDVDRAGASVFQAFANYWARRVAAERFPDHLRTLASGAVGFVAHELITHGNNGWFLSQEALTSAIRSTMSDAVAWLHARLGSDVARWTWGRLHPITLTHRLAALFPALGAAMNVGPFPCAGTVGVLNQQGFVEGGLLETVSGPHYRFVADLSSPDTALGCNTTGNSGHASSPHYADQTADWLAGRYHTLNMDRVVIEAEAEGRTTIRPRTHD